VTREPCPPSFACLGPLDDSDEVGPAVQGARLAAGGVLFFQPALVLFKGFFVAVY